MFESVLVANRGEIAVRVIRTCQRLGVKAIAVHSEADAGALHVRVADEAVLLGPAPAAESYLDIGRVLEAAQVTGAQAIHPGYGFLAENAQFARRVTAAGLAWIGPAPEAIEAMGDKLAARAAMAAAGVPVAPGTEPLPDADAAAAAAARIGYPVMVKAAAGGGGIGMAAVDDEPALRAAYETARTRAERFFGSPAVFLERYLPHARHVEVQVLGLTDGRVLALGERDCSVQRRHQKVAEESPSPGVTPQLRAQMLAAARRAAQAVDYRGAGTVECLVPTDGSGEFFFLEMNTRLQVEHPVTELVTRIDLVEQQLLIAAGKPVSFTDVEPIGHALEFRVYAEDPKRFLPGPGQIKVWVEPEGADIRVDAGYAEGNTVTPFYDPLMAKLCAWGEDRRTAIERLRAAVAGFRIEGPKHNLPFFTELLANPDFVAGTYDTGLVDRMRASR
ncbi:MAG TPA: biotin carboxylase N-terminal domain-containing protein [Mycobacteriales bacterium]|nr:biotin carboxylase N-terminal domain-containing protein [Mycobacteriales bacterium]